MTKPLQHLRLSRPLVVVDVETTGTIPKQNRIIEIATLSSSRLASGCASTMTPAASTADDAVAERPPSSASP
jgi:oligoribonuclease (3'-5' exoribonuclease)